VLSRRKGEETLLLCFYKPSSGILTTFRLIDSRALEEQRMLLQSLAMKENAVKGFLGLKWDSNLNKLKKDTCIILYNIRNSVGRLTSERK
jgi:hypothetical protein